MKKSLLFAALLLLASNLPAAPAQNSDPEILKAKAGVRDYTNVFPPHVKTIAVITPASYPNPKYSNRGIALLKKAGYKVKVYPNAFNKPEGVEKNPYTAVALDLRVKDFEAAWNDKENDLIICTRGGSGTANLVASVNWSKLPRRPELYVMGYSDVTMLLCALHVKGYGRPMAGPVLSSLSSLEFAIIPEMKKMFHGEALTPIKLKKVSGGDCSGKMIAGLLSRLASSVRKQYGVDTKGKIVIMEVIRSTPEKIKADLDELLKAKFFDGAAGIVFGHILQSGSKAEINALVKDFAKQVKLPVYTGLPFGHNNKHMTIDFAREAVIKDGVISFPAVKK